jgi:wyosine [tRNA(Phe)-imidazoG37] synthetase (radical SAM superfamily)
MNTAYPMINKAWKLKSTVVYGPFPTRRKGMALGINVLARDEKFCSFDCVYCQCGWTRDFDPATTKLEHYLSLEEIKQELDTSFSKVKETGQGVDSIVLSGNGEPTLHPQFDKVVEILKESRDRYFPDIDIQCLTAGTELQRPEVIRGLNNLERPTIKVDAADDKTLRILNRPLVNFDLEKLEKDLAQIDKVYIQTCFFEGRLSNVGDEAIEAYLTLIARIKPLEVEIYSIHRQPPAKGLKPVDLAFLKQIAKQLKEKAGINSLVV